MSVIKTLVPYYLEIPFTSPLTSVIATAYTLQIFVWDGLKSSVPVNPAYEITKKNPTGTGGNDKINISRLINDYIDFEPNVSSTTGIYDGNNQVWVKTQVIYTTTDEDDDGTVQLENTILAIQGNTYGLDGENAQPPVNRILLNNTEFKVDRRGFFCVPFLASEVDSYAVSINSYPIGSISYSGTISPSTDSSEMVQNIIVKCLDSIDDTVIEVVVNGVTIELFVNDECRYTPINILFQNKEGAVQIFPFFKAKYESISTTSDEFESDRGQPNAGNHQFIRYNVQGRSKFRINSGFVNENMNATFKEMLLSERCWSYDGTNLVPLNISSPSFEYKTREKDRLINYEVEFTYAFNDINTI